MSDSFGYVKEDSSFWGDPPLPENIDISNPGVSPYDARADHSHSLLFSNFVFPNLVNGWTTLGSGYRTPGIRRIGNLAICRGVILGGPVGASTIATISADYTPSQHEVFACDSQSGHCRIDVQSGGFIVCYSHPNVNDYIALQLIWAID